MFRHMARWEYRTYGVAHRLPKPFPGSKGVPGLPDTFEDWLVELNRLGSEGWEVVAPITTYMKARDERSSQLLLKRPLP